jgi:hypothetical protein
MDVRNTKNVGDFIYLVGPRKKIQNIQIKWLAAFPPLDTADGLRWLHNVLDVLLPNWVFVCKYLRNMHEIEQVGYTTLTISIHNAICTTTCRE